MLLFWSEDHVAPWCRDWSQPHGALLPLDQCWQLALAWYGPDRRDPHWQRKPVAEAEALFARLGLVGPFWSLGGA